MKNLYSQICYYYALMSSKWTREIEHNLHISAHISGIANNAVSFLGVMTKLNNNKSSNTYFSVNVST